jgi:uncharacterized protein (TIGR02217 family)
MAEAQRMSFLETPRFPYCPSFGYVFRPRYRTDIVRNTVDDEKRSSLWLYPKHDCQVTVGPRMEDEIDALLDFYHAVGGEFMGFRVKNFGDFKSCRPSQIPTNVDQPTVATGVTNQFQLVKRYTVGAATRDRIILKPVAGTILVSDNGATANPANYAINTATGVITFSVAPTGPVKWGGQFDVPMRFSGDFPISILNKSGSGSFYTSVTFMLEETGRDLA